MKVNHSLSSAEKRKRRVRSKVRGTTERPRLHVFRSNIATYLQVIDDTAGKTLASATTIAIKAKKGMTKTQKAEAAATDLAAKLKKVNISRLVFDRGSYKYHGRVKVVADAMRAQGFEL